MAAPVAGLLKLFVRSGGKNPGTMAKALNKKGVKIKKKMRKPLLIIAVQILQKASANCPVQTGALRASGRIQVAGSITMDRGVNSYAIVFGGGGTGVDYARAVEYTSKAYLRPAVASVKNSPGTKGAFIKVMNDTWKG